MSTKTDIILCSPEDWTEWDREFESKAVAMDLWDYIKENPDELLTKPVRPNPADYRLAGATTRSQSSTISGGSSTIDLNPEETRNFQVAWNVYTDKKKEYDAQKDNIRNLKSWVSSTIAQHYKDSS